MTFEEFAQITEEELALLPDYVHEELNGGVVVDDKAKLHPGRLADDRSVRNVRVSPKRTPKRSPLKKKASASAKSIPSTSCARAHAL